MFPQYLGTNCVKGRSLSQNAKCQKGRTRPSRRDRRKGAGARIEDALETALFAAAAPPVPPEGPAVRISFPPALSPLRTSFSGGKRGKVRGDDKGRSRR